MRKKLLENVKEVCRKDVDVRRYALPDMISESYKLLYDVPANTRLKKMVESHVVDVQKNPRDIDRLSEQLCTLKAVYQKVSEGKSEEELLVPEEYYDTVEPKKNRVEIHPETEIQESEKPKRTRRRRTSEAKKLKESSDTPDLTDEELEELAKHLETIRKEKKEDPTSEKKEETDESASPHKRHHKDEGCSGKKEDLDESAPSTDNFLNAHDNADNYRNYSAAFDQAYKILDKYVQEGENPDNLGVDVLYDRATDEDKRKVYNLVTGAESGKSVVQISLDVVTDLNPSVLAENMATFLEEEWGLQVAGCLPTGAGWTIEEYEDMIGRSLFESKKLNEGYSDGTASIDDIREMAGRLDDLAVDMENEEMEDIHLSPNTYGLGNHYVAFPGGFLDLDDLSKYFEEDEEYDEYDESKKVRESRKVRKGYRGLRNFSKMSESKAFYKTFKKLHESLKEGKALTRQESIDLYKAANSAMTQLSIELEHNPKFLKTFTEATSLLSKDVNSLRESLSRDKAPSKATMKSLAKFSSVLLRESAALDQVVEDYIKNLAKKNPDRWLEDLDKDDEAGDLAAQGADFDEIGDLYAELAVYQAVGSPDNHNYMDYNDAIEHAKEVINQLNDMYEAKKVNEAKDDEEDKEKDEDPTVEEPTEDTPSEDEVPADPDAIPKENPEDFVGDDEGDIDHEPSPEEEEFDQEYADARQEVQDELQDKFADSEDEFVQSKLEADRVEVAVLKGEDPDAEGEGEEDIEDPEAPDESEESSDDEDSEVPDADVTDDELEELKRHLKEMRSAKGGTES